MWAFEKIDELRAFLAIERAKGHTIGFVPTMGALHEGHISLINKACAETDIVVCSIFVNPIQFNNPGDLEKYPRTLELDSLKLEVAGCHVLFHPSVSEMYPEPDKREFDFGKMGEVMEGQFRPGHFNGVAIVVDRLFNIVEPTKAYFGQKDFQQLAIIKKLIEITDSPIKVIGCSTLREESGLAMSSRNLRLSDEEKQEATLIYHALSKAREMAEAGANVPTIKDKVKALFKVSPTLELEYFEIVDANTLMPVLEITESNEIVACVAAWMGEVRLIDNMMLVGD